MKPEEWAKKKTPKYDSPPPVDIRKRSWKRPLVLVLLLFLSGTATWAVFELGLFSKIPSELVGKWVVTEGPQEGATFDFYRNGSLLGNVNAGGQAAKLDARIEVNGKNLFSTTVNPSTHNEETRTQVIRELTATRLVLEDEQGHLLKMERAE